MNPFALLAPLFLLFEVGQLVVSERYLGIKQIRLNTDPRNQPMATWLAASWTGGIIVYFAWMLTLLLHPVGRAQGIVLLATTAIGYAFRASASLKWILVILTFEGAVRVGMLLSLTGSAWRHLGG